MDYETYRKKYFADLQPEPRFKFSGAFGATLYYQDYQEALAFYKKVLGPPAYIEGENTHGWKIGETWLTLFPSKSGNPINVEIPFYMASPEEVDRLYQAFIAAGAKGDPPENGIMYRLVRLCVLTDPFGVSILVVCNLAG
jgi:hypothetical protein